MYTESIVDWGRKEREKKSHDFSSYFKHGCCVLCKRKLTRQNRYSYPRTNLGARCKAVSDEGISFGCLRMQRVCTERRTRPGTTARRPNLAPTSLPRWPPSRSVRAQDSQSCYRYLGQHCFRRRRRLSCLCLQSHCCCCCCCLCWALNSPHRNSGAAGCSTSCNTDCKTPPKSTALRLKASGLCCYLATFAGL